MVCQVTPQVYLATLRLADLVTPHQLAFRRQVYLVTPLRVDLPATHRLAVTHQLATPLLEGLGLLVSESCGGREGRRE